MKKSLFFLLVLVSFLSVSNFASADIVLPNPLGSVGTVADLVSNITSYIFSLIGILAVLMFVISGVLFVISAGNPGKIDQAKKIAIYAAVGTGIALSGAGLIALVKQILTGTP